MQDSKLVLEVSFVVCVSYSLGRNTTGTAGQGSANSIVIAKLTGFLFR